MGADMLSMIRTAHFALVPTLCHSASFPVTPPPHLPALIQIHMKLLHQSPVVQLLEHFQFECSLIHPCTTLQYPMSDPFHRSSHTSSSRVPKYPNTLPMHTASCHTPDSPHPFPSGMETSPRTPCLLVLCSSAFPPTHSSV